MTREKDNSSAAGAAPLPVNKQLVLHSALPWHVDPKAAEESFFQDVNILLHSGLAVAVAVHNGDIPPDAVAANAAFIVKAVNCHHDLLAALRLVAKGLRSKHINDQTLIDTKSDGPEARMFTLSSVVFAALTKAGA